MSDKLTKASFEKHVNTKFKAPFPGHEYIELELIKIEEKKDDAIEAFTLIFKGPSGKLLHDNTYALDHDKMGKVEIFISPYKENSEGVFYDVQFVRLKNE